MIVQNFKSQLDSLSPKSLKAERADLAAFDGNEDIIAYIDARLGAVGEARSTTSPSPTATTASPGPSRPTLSYKTALHESGHCVAAMSFGWTPGRVSVSEDGSGRCEIDPVRLDALAAAEQVAVAVVGLYAVRRAGYLAELNYVDAAYARWGVSKAQGTIPRNEAEQQGELLAEHVINDHWPQIEKLADALVRRGSLTGEDIKRIVESD